MDASKDASDLRIIPIPKGVLLEMWDKLDKSKQDYVEQKIGCLISLLHVEPQVALIKALAHFWNATTSTFVFGNQYELTPTLEEYDIIINRQMTSFGSVKPPIGLDPVPTLSEFLQVKAINIRDVMRGSSKALPLSYLKLIINELPVESIQRAKVFLLAFFGFVIFPHTQKTMNPQVGYIVKQICQLKGFTNMILAETFLSLSRFKEKTCSVLKAPIGLLQVWFLSHIKEFGGSMMISQVNKDSHPLSKLIGIEKLLNPWSFPSWFDFLKLLTPKQILWQAHWVGFPKARLTIGLDDPIPLLGFTGSTSYYPLRVARQYRMLQEIPPPLKLGLYRFDFREEAVKKDQIEHLQKEVDKIDEILRCCIPRDVEWVVTELEGEMKLHHASRDFIIRCLEPKLKVIIPHVSPNPTPREAHMGRLIRERDEALAKMERLAEENKRLRREFSGNTSQS